MAAREQTGTAYGTRSNCCPLYHEAVELVGRRWTGAILQVLMDGPMRFSEIAQSIPELSDRLLSERMKELEARGIVQRTVIAGPPLRVQYELSKMGHELEPALAALQSWARRWLGDHPAPSAKRDHPTSGTKPEHSASGATPEHSASGANR
jgi:DNA-binding HxlR family transcriptional regulator